MEALNLHLLEHFSFYFWPCMWLTESYFPYQGLNPGLSSESAESQPPDSQRITSCNIYKFKNCIFFLLYLSEMADIN